MKLRMKIGAILLSVCMLIPMFCVITYAAPGSISVSSASGNVGSTVSISCTVKSNSGAIGTADVVLTYNPNALQYVGGSGGYSLTGGSGSVIYHGLTSDGSTSSLKFTVKFKILTEGSHKVSTSSVNALNLNEEPLAIGGTSGTITGKKPVEVVPKDGNNKLSSLQVSVGSLEPAFDATTTSYTVVVPEETTEVTIAATPQSNKAQVAVTGGAALRLGANTATVVVTAENGETLTYTITIMCGEAEKIQIDGKQYVFNYDFPDEQIPIGFTRTKVTYNGREYEAVTNEKDAIRLVNLQNGDLTAFYIYKQDSEEFLPFVQVILSEGKYIIPLALDAKYEQFAAYEKMSIAYADKQFDAWKLDDEFGVVCVMNQDGDELLYRYDCVDGIFQRYVEMTQETAIFPSEYYMYTIVGLGILSLILLVAMIYFIASRKSRHEGRKRKAIKRMEKQRAKEEKELAKQNKKNNEE